MVRTLFARLPRSLPLFSVFSVPLWPIVFSRGLDFPYEKCEHFNPQVTITHR
jgi:hypothetical protein